MVLYLFLTHLGAGVVLTLLLVSREAGIKFFRFNAGLALAFVAIGAAFHAPARTGGSSTWDTAGLWALGVMGAALAIYWIVVGRALRPLQPALLIAATVAGAAMLVAQALDVSLDAAVFVRALTVASFASSAALLGGACTAMILGHWYLVLPSLDVVHLQRIVRFHGASLLARAALVGAAVFLAVSVTQPGSVPFDRYIFSISGIFFWQRVLFGLAGPAVLAYLVAETAKIRSTQSATGILYVDLFTVIVGEVLSKYLLLATKVPL